MQRQLVRVQVADQAPEAQPLVVAFVLALSLPPQNVPCLMTTRTGFGCGLRSTAVSLAR